MFNVRPILLALALVSSFAATTVHALDAPISDRSVPGEVVPSTGVMVPEKPSRPPLPPRPRRPLPPKATAGSLGGGGSTVNCDALRARYARSQSCFAPYRLQNGGIKPEAFKYCKQVPNPSLKCGSAVVQ